jgi:hypothetical protein
MSRGRSALDAAHKERPHQHDGWWESKGLRSSCAGKAGAVHRSQTTTALPAPVLAAVARSPGHTLPRDTPTRPARPAVWIVALMPFSPRRSP